MVQKSLKALLRNIKMAPYMEVMRKALHAVNHVIPINHVPGKWEIWLHESLIF